MLRELAMREQQKGRPLRFRESMRVIKEVKRREMGAQPAANESDKKGTHSLKI
jgi:hypothetical protein